MTRLYLTHVVSVRTVDEAELLCFCIHFCVCMFPSTTWKMFPIPRQQIIKSSPRRQSQTAAVVCEQNTMKTEKKKKKKKAVDDAVVRTSFGSDRW